MTHVLYYRWNALIINKRLIHNLSRKEIVIVKFGILTTSPWFGQTQPVMKLVLHALVKK